MTRIPEEEEEEEDPSEREIQLTGNLGLWINSPLQRHKDRFHKKNFFFIIFLLVLLDGPRLRAKT
jgi:hypothetical protein